MDRVSSLCGVQSSSARDNEIGLSVRVTFDVDDQTSGVTPQSEEEVVAACAGERSMRTA